MPTELNIYMNNEIVGEAKLILRKYKYGVQDDLVLSDYGDMYEKGIEYKLAKKHSNAIINVEENIIISFDTLPTIIKLLGKKDFSYYIYDEEGNEVKRNILYEKNW